MCSVEFDPKILSNFQILHEELLVSMGNVSGFMKHYTAPSIARMVLWKESLERELEAVEPYIMQGFTEPIATRYLIYPPRYTFSSEMATVSQCSLPFPLYFHRVAVVDLLSLSGYMPPLVIYPPPPWPTYHPTYILKLEFLNRKNHAGPSIFESSVLCVSLLTVCAYTYGWYYFLLQLH